MCVMGFNVSQNVHHCFQLEVKSLFRCTKRCSKIGSSVTAAQKCLLIYVQHGFPSFTYLTRLGYQLELLSDIIIIILFLYSNWISWARKVHSRCAKRSASSLCRRTREQMGLKNKWDFTVWKQWKPKLNGEVARYMIMSPNMRYKSSQ